MKDTPPRYTYLDCSGITARVALTLIACTRRQLTETSPKELADELNAAERFFKEELARVR